MIPMVDLKAQYHALKEDIDAAVLAVLENTQFILGPNVTALEKEISDYLGVKHAITCASGTDVSPLLRRFVMLGLNRSLWILIRRHLILIRKR